MKPLFIYYSEASPNRLTMLSGRVIMQFQIAALVDIAFQRSTSMSIAFNAFRATGNLSLNRDIFSDDDILASTATDIELPCPSSTLCASIHPVSSIQDTQPSTPRAYESVFRIRPRDIMLLSN